MVQTQAPRVPARPESSIKKRRETRRLFWGIGLKDADPRREHGPNRTIIISVFNPDSKVSVEFAITLAHSRS